MRARASLLLVGALLCGCAGARTSVSVDGVDAPVSLTRAVYSGNGDVLVEGRELDVLGSFSVTTTAYSTLWALAPPLSSLDLSEMLNAQLAKFGGEAITSLKFTVENLNTAPEVLIHTLAVLLPALPGWCDVKVEGNVVRRALPPEPAPTPARLRVDSAARYYLAGLKKNDAGDSRRALEDLNAALRSDPTYVLARVERARARVALGEYVGALADCDAATQIGVPQGQRLNTRWYRAQAAYNLDRFPEALADLDWVLTGTPGFALGYRLRGLTKAHLYDVNGALADFDAFLRGSDLKDPATLDLAILAGALGDTRHLRGAPIEGWPAPVARWLLGEVSEADLLASLERIRPIAAREAWRACIECYLGLLYDRQGDAQTASVHYQRASEASQGQWVQSFEGAFAQRRLAALLR